MTWMIKLALRFLRFAFFWKRIFTRKKTIFLICPVRNSSDSVDEILRGYVHLKESEGYDVHYPKIDTIQTGDLIGTRICYDNLLQVFLRDEVHIWWDANSVGSKFDFGALFMLTRILDLPKRVVLVNRDKVPINSDGKHFDNVAHAMEIGDEETLRMIRHAKREKEREELRHI
jgi:hypothetical protein